MQVIKRDGVCEDVYFDKILRRIRSLTTGLDPMVDPVQISTKVIQGLYHGVTTVELDNLAAETAAYMSSNHSDFAVLAARLAVSNLQKQTPKSFSECIQVLASHQPNSLVSEELIEIVQKYKERLNSAIIHERDFGFSYFGFKTLESSYLQKMGKKIVETPQYLFMRVSLGIHGDDIDSAIETYDYMSQRFFIHATPTLFNAGTPHSQLASCFLVNMKEDSIEGIYDTLKTCALISKMSGGIGLNVSNVRAIGSYIAGTNGTSSGIIPMLRVFNTTARYVNQGGNKRPGAVAIYLEPWHEDIESWLELRLNQGKEEERCRDLFLGLWVPDLFMKRVEEDGLWSLMCPHECPGLEEVHSQAFESLYMSYERQKKYRRQVSARTLWNEMIRIQSETGTPFILFKDACNRKSNQQNLGTIKGSNLCTEVIQYSSPDEVAVCNLASIGLPMFVTPERTFDFQKLRQIVRILVKNLNKVIDRTTYPVKEAEKSNRRHRPMGLGVQGLADVFFLMRYPFDSPQAAELNKKIFECIYYAACEMSIELAEKEGPYVTFPGSPASKGLFQFDLWGVQPSNDWPWEQLRQRMITTGIRNSLLIAPMPTASTSQILGFNECIEAMTNNLYTRRVTAGEFVVINQYLIKDLMSINLWNDKMRDAIKRNKGSIQKIDGIPQELKDLYKTVWEISQKVVVNMAADRGAFIDQSQSLNLHVENCTPDKMTSMHFYIWKKGLKGSYYLRSSAAVSAVPVTLSVERPKQEVVTSGPICTKENGCLVCSS